MVDRENLSFLPAVLVMIMASTPLAVAGEVRDEQPSKVLHAGIIGLDTSHVTAFTSLLNGPHAEGDLAGVRIVAAYAGGSAGYSFQPRSRCRLHARAARKVRCRDRWFD